jgi:predicted XRE-type DNA-binding protein
VRLLRARIIAEIGGLIRKQGLTQTAAAHKLRIRQPDVFRLLDGQTSGFSVDRLLTFLTLLGRRVIIRSQPANKRRAQLVFNRA